MLSPTSARRLRLASRVGYVLVILLATLTNLHVDLDPARTAARFERALHWALSGSDVVDAARNVALFAGFGVVWIVTSPPDDRPWRQVARITLFGFLLSVCVEVVQLVSESRTASINDLATNTAGALAGALAIMTMVTVLRRVRPARSYVGFPLFPIAGAYAAAVATDIFAPFYGRERIPGPGGSIYDRLIYALQFVRGATPQSISLFDTVAFAPAGVMLVLMLAEFGFSYGAACGLTVAGGLVVSAVLEVAHGVAGQRIQIGAIVSHTFGIALGAVIAWRAAPAVLKRVPGRRGLATILLVVYAFLLAVWAWRPFVPRPNLAVILDQLTLVHLTPLGLMGGEVDLFGVMDIIRQFCLYLGLGSLLAVWPLRRHGRLAFVLPGVYLAIVLELGQLLVFARTFDVTDILTQCAAVGVGYVVVKRAGWDALGELLDGGRQGGTPQIIYPMSAGDARSRRRVRR